MLLQAMADQFGVPVTEYAHAAFNAKLSPKFSYGCAVFLDSDRVNFQKEGYNKEELMAGLAMVLPKNVWQYVVQIPRMAELGRRFVLQGGTQHNLAAVKAQVDYIKDRVPDAEVFVHPHPGEAGAIGAAMETLRVVRKRGSSRFVGLEQAINISYSTQNDEETRCNFCPNHCSRTFINTKTPDGATARYISGFSCEKGTVEDWDALRELNKKRREIMKEFPNLVTYESRRLFAHFFSPEPLPAAGTLIDDIKVKRSLLGQIRHKQITRKFRRSGPEAIKRRQNLRIGMVKCLNMWSTGPFWRTYFEALGVKQNQIVFSDDSSEEMFAQGGKYGSVDPCYPSKVAQAHIHNLLFKHHPSKKLDVIFFPTITHIPSFLENVSDHASCPIAAGTPNVMKAAFTKEQDFFKQRGILYKDEAVNFAEQRLMKRQLFEAWGEFLQITEDENDHAVDQGFSALRSFDEDLQEKGKVILEQAEEENRMCILLLGRPYHLDPGMNHDITEEFQALGYPILSMRSLPRDPDWLKRIFGKDIQSGVIDSALEITDVWPENYSSNSAQKVWAAKFAARHPNLAVLDLSSFKCGHDAPTYGIIDKIITTSNTAYSALHDIDANKPGGSIKIRVKTYAYSLALRAEHLETTVGKKRMLERALKFKKLELLKAKLETLKLSCEEVPESIFQEMDQLNKELNARSEHLASVGLECEKADKERRPEPETGEMYPLQIEDEKNIDQQAVWFQVF